jgi:hypothetical protein
MMKRPAAWATAALAATGLLVLAGCGTASSAGTGSQPSEQPSSAPAAVATWQPGGTYTGPVPPANGVLPGPTGKWLLPPITTQEGYKVSDNVVLGVPLHYAIPNTMKDCYSAYSYSQDLPPGQYVIPFAITIQNLTGQQARAAYPVVWASNPDGATTVDMTSSGANGNDESGLWQDGSCNSQVNMITNSGGSATLYGLIGPATPAQLAALTLNVSWQNGAAPGATTPQYTSRLMARMPHVGASWLVANG